MQEVQGDSARASSRLLALGEDAPFAVDNSGGASPILLLGDHAGRVIPSALGELGLGGEDLARHIAWDIGVAGLGLKLARRLDCVFIRQIYSRLVIDCNRDPDVAQSIPERSDGSHISGNLGLSEAAKAARREEIFAPYHARIAAEIAARAAVGRATILFALHSFTPVMAGFVRPWRFGVVHSNDSPFSSAVLASLRAAGLGEVGDNEPYAMDGIDFTIPFHADPRGLDYLELEVRQDLIADESGQDAIAAALAPVFSALVSPLDGGFARAPAIG